MKILYEFANSIGVESDRVKEFIQKKKNPNSLEELLALPQEMRCSGDFISEFGEEVKDYVWENWGDYPGRYSSVSLERMVDSLLEDIYESKTISEEALMESNPSQLRDLKKNHKKISKELEVAAQIIEEKFNSIVVDW